jgi:soluble lytic murein transglycosylase-like protein
VLGRVASALGAGFGGQAAKDVGAPEVVGSIAGGLVPAGVVGAYKGLSAAGRAIVPDYDLAANEAAEAAIKAAGVDKAKALKALAQENLPKNLRVAEIAKDPGLISISKRLEIESPIAKKLGFDLDEARESARQLQILQAQGTIKLPENAGITIREGFEEGLKQAKKATKEAYDAVTGMPGKVSLSGAKRKIYDAIIDVGGEESIAPGALRRLKEFQSSKATASVDDFIELQKKITSELRTYSRIVKSGQGTTPEIANGYRALAQAARAIDEALVSSAKTGRVPAKTAAALEKAKALRIKQGEMFESYAVGDVLAKDGFQPKMLPSTVPQRLFRTPEEARQAFKALKATGDSNAMQDLRSQFFEQLKNKATSATTGEFTAAGFAREWRKMKPIAKEFLEPKQIKAINQVRGDLLARSRYDRLSRSATVGTSPTAEYLGTAGTITRAIASKATRLLGPLGRLIDNVSGDRAKEIAKRADEILLKMSFEPKFAADFLANPPTAKNVQSIANGLIARGILPGVGKAAMAKEEENKNLAIPKLTREKIERIAETTATATPTATPVPPKVDDKLIAAIIKQESAGNPKAVSKAGAVGLMQLMPATAKEVAAELGIKDPDLRDPETNKKLGTHYFNKQLKAFGDVELALAAYNAGPARVRQWQKKYGNTWAEISKAIRRIRPDHETLDYVPKILRNYGRV